MPRNVRVGAALTAALVALFALHVQLNLGGWRHFVSRMTRGGEVRGELVVGFLPVT